MNLKQCDKAIQLDKAALASDPLDPNMYETFVFEVLLRCERYAEAEAAERRALSISPQYGNARYFLGEALLLQGRLPEALAEMQKETIDDGRYEGSAMVYFAMGRRAESDAALKLGAEHNGESWPSIKEDPLVKNVKGDPRFQALLGNMNLAE